MQRLRDNWTAVVIGGLVFWSVYFLAAWAFNWFAWFGAVDQLAILLLGVLVTLAEKWTTDHRILVLTAFGVLGITGTIAMVIEGKSADAERRAMYSLQEKALNAQVESANKQAEASDKLGGAVDRVSDVAAQSLEGGKKTIELQKRLLGTVDEVKLRSLEAINLQTGGDSYCYLAISSIGTDGFLPSVIHIGKYPLSGVQVRIVDLDNMPPTTLQGMAMGTREIGDIAAHAAFTDIRWRLPITDKDTRSFNVFFAAKNGFWTERYRLRKVNGEWRDSIVVDRLNFRTNNYEQIMEKTDPLFGPAMP